LGLIAFVDATGQTPSSLKNHKSERSVPKATFWVPDSSVRKETHGAYGICRCDRSEPIISENATIRTKTCFRRFHKNFNTEVSKAQREGNHFWGSYRTLEKPLILTNGPKTTGSGIGGRPFGYVSATKAISIPIIFTRNDNYVAAADVLIPNRMYRFCIKNRSYNSS
jgi:hypothetical protein